VGKTAAKNSYLVTVSIEKVINTAVGVLNSFLPLAHLFKTPDYYKGIRWTKI